MARRIGANRHKGLKWFVILILLIIISIYGVIFTEKIVKPNITAIAEVRVKALFNQIINDAVIQQIASFDYTDGELLKINTDNDGNITLLEPNTMLMNRLSTEMVKEIQAQFRTIEPRKVTVPVGSIVGSQIMSQFGPSLDLKVIPIGMSRASYKTEFESTGINQTKYKVYLEMDSQARVLSPFSMKNIEVKNTILIAEAIIVGEVPDSYIFVPEDSLIDGADIAL
ncbi:MAG: sporulation protein YunB [Anaerovoracaceae bacterium]|jgi:sporulation protein YunB